MLPICKTNWMENNNWCIHLCWVWRAGSYWLSGILHSSIGHQLLGDLCALGIYKNIQKVSTKLSGNFVLILKKQEETVLSAQNPNSSLNSWADGGRITRFLSVKIYKIMKSLEMICKPSLVLCELFLHKDTFACQFFTAWYCHPLRFSGF